MGNPSQSYGIWDQTVLPATQHKWTCPAIIPANHVSTRFTYPRRMESWVDLGSLIAARPGIESTTDWSQVRRPNRYTTKTPILVIYFTTTSDVRFWPSDDICQCRYQVWMIVHAGGSWHIQTDRPYNGNMCHNRRNRLQWCRLKIILFTSKCTKLHSLSGPALTLGELTVLSQTP